MVCSVFSYILTPNIMIINKPAIEQSQRQSSGADGYWVEREQPFTSKFLKVEPDTKVHTRLQSLFRSTKDGISK